MDSTLYGPFTQELGLMILVDSFQSRTSWKLCKQRFILTMLNVLCSQDKKNGTLMQLCCWRTVAGAAGASPGWWQVHMDLRRAREAADGQEQTDWTLHHHIPEEAQQVNVDIFEYQVKKMIKLSRFLSRPEVGRCAVFTKHSFTSRIAST